MLVQKPTITDIVALQTLIAHSDNQEKQCQAFLEFVAPQLASTSGRVIQHRREGRCSRGDWDFAVTVEVASGSRIRTETYIWEAKSPQKKMFRYDEAQRLLPSADLVRAETQLLYYAHVCETDRGFRASLGTGNDGGVYPGGIIMSRMSDPVQWTGRGHALKQTEKEWLAQEAFMVRERYLYSEANIRIYFWDTLVTWLTDMIPRTQALAASGV